MYGFTDGQLWGSSEARNIPDERYVRKDGTSLTPREALQRLGTEFGRSCYEDTWVDICLDTCQKVLTGEAYDPTKGLNPSFLDCIFKNSPGGVVVPDLRYQNEAAKLRDRGAVIIRLDPTWESGPSPGVEGHSSEKLQIGDDLIDFVINVPKGLPAFYLEVDSAIRRASNYKRGVL